MKLLSVILDILYPPKCAFCRKLVPAGAGGVCRTCRETLPYTKDGGEMHGNFFTECLSPLYYEGAVRDALLRYKFHQMTAYSAPLGDLLGECVAARLDETVDFISWVPLSRKRLRRRGYDQARLVAERAAAMLGLPCVPVLVKVRDTPPQSRTGDEEKRKANIAGAYRVASPEAARDKRILLIDDIVTTGSTLSECARMLGMAGAERVVCATVARKRDENRRGEAEC